MGRYPQTLTALERLVPTEAAKARLLAKLRWPEGFVCPRCGSQGAWRAARGGLLRCRRCDAQTSVTAGTIFHGTRRGLRAWFRAIWHVAARPEGANALDIQRTLRLGSYRTAWAWLHKLRGAMVGRPGDLLTGVVAAGGEAVRRRGRWSSWPCRTPAGIRGVCGCAGCRTARPPASRPRCGGQST